ncbi:DUF6463 family protein [Tabrizicola sp.]|uniref:DUF6463 family protein n=1 Tax=Tabrizicola sp. TaxID=2005166 RepID=UPI003F31B2A1
MIKWAGWLIVFYGTAHTLGALTLEGAAEHAGAWFSGELWSEDFSAMDAAGTAYWFSLASFGLPLTLIGLMVLWMNRRRIVPPPFLGVTLGLWTMIDATVLLLTPWPILLVASGLLFFGSRQRE